MPNEIAAQVTGVHTADQAARRLADVEVTLARLTNLVEKLSSANSTAAPTPGGTPPAGGPALFADTQPASKSALRPNPPFVFDGDRRQGRAFLHAVKTYTRLLPEAFLVNGVTSEEKAVRFALSYMAKDSAQKWAERQSEKLPFPFPTWASFVNEFRLRFVEENEQDHALLKLESRGYYMGTRDVWAYTDDFEDLFDIAGILDDLVKVTKYRSGLDPQVNVAITTSANPPSLRDYTGWRSRAYRQYESLTQGRTISGQGRAPVPSPVARPRGGVLPAVPPAPRPAQPPRVAPPPLPPAVPMDVDRARARTSLPRTCYRRGAAGHLARDCTAPADVRSTDVIDEVIRQLGDDLLDELVARLRTSDDLPAEPQVNEVPPVDFPLRGE